MTVDEMPDFWPYATFDERGVFNGIREDTPEEYKKSYEKYLEEEKAWKEKVKQMCLKRQR